MAKKGQLQVIAFIVIILIILAVFAFYSLFLVGQGEACVDISKNTEVMNSSTCYDEVNFITYLSAQTTQDGFKVIFSNDSSRRPFTIRNGSSNQDVRQASGEFGNEIILVPEERNDFVFKGIYKSVKFYPRAGFFTCDLKSNFSILPCGSNSVYTYEEYSQEQSVLQSTMAPVALFNHSLIQGRTLAFDGSQSYDSDGSIVNYIWDFGDGTGGGGVYTEHTFNADGNYNVLLIVVDNAGFTGSFSREYLFANGSLALNSGNVTTNSTNVTISNSTIINNSTNSTNSTICGNGIIEVNETCDGNTIGCTTSGGYSGAQACNIMCNGYLACNSSMFCGDGIINGNEQCDDNNTISGDGCSSSCILEGGPEGGGGDSGTGLDFGLVAHWKLDENGGLTALDSVSNYDGTLINGPTWAAGKIGSALSFDGLNDYVSIGDLDVNPLTVSLWMNLNYSTDNWVSLAMKRYTYGFETERSNVFFGIGNGTNWNRHAYIPIAIGRWTHVVGTYDGLNLRIYRDGLLTTGPLSASLSNSDMPLLIGSWNTKSEFYPGLIDDVRIYNRALNASEVADLYSYEGLFSSGEKPRFEYLTGYFTDGGFGRGSAAALAAIVALAALIFVLIRSRKAL